MSKAKENKVKLQEMKQYLKEHIVLLTSKVDSRHHDGQQLPPHDDDDDDANDANDDNWNLMSLFLVRNVALQMAK
uniref:Uncharacterized protein n=1 Tax=Glossina brevipalpis TaxID=37001 RepID=A0A1A9WEJ8_9MUSC